MSELLQNHAEHALIENIQSMFIRRFTALENHRQFTAENEAMEGEEGEEEEDEEEGEEDDMRYDVWNTYGRRMEEKGEGMGGGMADRDWGGYHRYSPVCLFDVLSSTAHLIDQEIPGGVPVGNHEAWEGEERRGGKGGREKEWVDSDLDYRQMLGLTLMNSILETSGVLNYQQTPHSYLTPPSLPTPSSHPHYFPSSPASPSPPPSPLRASFSPLRMIPQPGEEGAEGVGLLRLLVNLGGKESAKLLKEVDDVSLGALMRTCRAMYEFFAKVFFFFFFFIFIYISFFFFFFFFFLYLFYFIFHFLFFYFLIIFLTFLFFFYFNQNQTFWEARLRLAWPTRRFFLDDAHFLLQFSWKEVSSLSLSLSLLPFPPQSLISPSFFPAVYPPQNHPKETTNKKSFHTSFDDLYYY